MSVEYDNYLDQHRGNVKKAWEWLKENIPEVEVYIDDCDSLISYDHDYSKNDICEYKAYDDYFYGKNRSFGVVQAFNYAWLQR